MALSQDQDATSDGQKAKPVPKGKPERKRTLTKAERKAAEAAAREAKRKAIADEYQRWEAIRRSRVL